MVSVIPKFSLFAPIFCIISSIALIACEGSYDHMINFSRSSPICPHFQLTQVPTNISIAINTLGM
jgi:hypothetical protein